MSVVDMLADRLTAEGYHIARPPDGQGHSFEAMKGNECVAVLVKEHKAKVNVSQVLCFQDYLRLDASKRFTGGWLLSTSGFFNTALTHVKTEEPPNLRLGTLSGNQTVWNFPGGGVVTVSVAPERRYFGVFTCKGGVGKTTVAAHLAGAFALVGFNVVLLDLDPDKNLRKLFLQPGEEGDASLYVPPKVKAESGTTITVLDHDQWDEKHYPDIKIVVCDCSPVLSENPRDLVGKFDYCIVPTTLNPLGVAKKADVITRTFAHIRGMNQKAEMFALINGYETSEEKRNGLLLGMLKSEIGKYTDKDAKCRFIDPDNASIRYSGALLYWGIHIVQGKPPELAFREVGGRSNPRVDFLKLAEYLENHTDIDTLQHAK